MKKILAGLLISAGCLYLVLRGVHWAEIPGHLGQVDAGLLALSMLGMLGAYALMAWRWRSLLAPLMAAPPPGLPTLFAGMMTGYFFNTFFPARAGDLMRAHLMSRRTGVSRATILATVVIEKLFDGLALLALLAVGLPALRVNGGAEQLGLVAIAALGAAIGALALFKWQTDRALALLARVVDLLPVPERLSGLLIRLAHTFSAGLRVFEKPGPLIRSAGISLLVWIVAAGMFWAALAAFHVPLPGAAAVLLMTAVVNLGLLIPAMPGNVGNYEALTLTALVLILPGIDKDLGVAFALIFHAAQLVATLLVGGLAFWTQRAMLRDVRPTAAEAVAARSPAEAAALREHGRHPAREEAAELGIDKL